MSQRIGGVRGNMDRKYENDGLQLSKRDSMNSHETNGHAMPASKFERQNSSNTSRPVINEPISPVGSHWLERKPNRMAASYGLGKDRDGFTDFFGPDVFQIVLRNPTTAHRLLKFCQSRACGENMEFLEKIEAYSRLLDDVAKLLGDIHQTYTSPDAPKEINIPYAMKRRIASDLKATAQATVPAMENIFGEAQDHIETLLAEDMYPRFVKHQITASATMALSDDKSRYQGLGDCFVLTDPSIADNPIVYASDGFVDVTGYSRHDIIPRNCRFLQGARTDRQSVQRLRVSIEGAEETVELLLNYRKNGEPFWNLLYVSPLYDSSGNVTFFLGGQINCSTTISSRTDILRVLSLPDDEIEEKEREKARLLLQGQEGRPGSTRSSQSVPASSGIKLRSGFFKTWRRQDLKQQALYEKNIREETGMEGELLDKVGNLNFKTQVEAFYTAYSKYLVLKYTSAGPTYSSSSLLISHYSPSTINMLGLNLPNGSVSQIYNRDIFKVLGDQTATSSNSTSALKALKNTVREKIRSGAAVSIELGLLTGTELKKGLGGRISEKRVEERYVSHWTPLKDEEGRVKWVVLTIAPK